MGVISFNIEGLNSNAQYLTDLLKTYSPDLIGLQATWTFSFQQPFQCLTEEYEYYYKSVDDEEMIPQSHLTSAHAGTANLWPSGKGKPLHDGNHRTCVSECTDSDII